MEFTCNVIKNDTNIRERGLPLLTARVMFDAEMVVVFCCPTPQRTHIISFRKANDREQNQFKTQSL